MKGIPARHAVSGAGQILHHIQWQHLRHEPMRSVNGFWAVCVASVSITCSSCQRSSWTASFMPMVSTSLEPGHRKRINQLIPERYGGPVPPYRDDGKILSLPILGGLHHD